MISLVAIPIALTLLAGSARLDCQNLATCSGCLQSRNSQLQGCGPIVSKESAPQRIHLRCRWLLRLMRGSGTTACFSEPMPVKPLSGLRLEVLLSVHASHSGQCRCVSLQSTTKAVESQKYESSLIRASFVGANPMPLLEGVDMLGHKCNYFIGKDRAGWRTDVPNFRAVVYRDIYPGIDLKYYGNEKQMEYDFVVSPGADPSQIQVRYDGVRSVAVDTEGRLVVRTDWGEVVEQQPVVYQVSDGRRHVIAGKYVLQGQSTFAFELIEEYDHSLATIIDPILSYSTYLGGSNDEYGAQIAIDRNGNAYVTGTTMCFEFPTYNASRTLMAVATSTSLLLNSIAPGPPCYTVRISGEP